MIIDLYQVDQKNVFVEQDIFSFFFFVDQRNVLYFHWSMVSKQTKILLAVPLCFRAMAVWEQKIPVDIAVAERHVTLAQYRKKLKTETQVVPDPFSLKAG